MVIVMGQGGVEKGPRLIGRDGELARVGRLLDGARAGQSHVLVLSGEPGVGKSALLQQAVGLATGMNVLRARGVQSEAHIPFAGLGDILRPALFLLDRLPGPQAEALQGALALVPSRAQDRFAIGSATHSLLVAYADLAPVLVAVDDAHWIDGSSADALSFAFRRLVADPVAVLLTIRSEHTATLGGSAQEWLEVAGLDLVGASELLKVEVGAVPESLLGRLHRETGGNPLALLEAAHHLDDLRRYGPPDTPLPVLIPVADIYLDRVRSLRSGAATLCLLAASSDPTDIRVLAKAAARLGADIADLADLEEARLVKVNESRVEFLHPLIRSAIYNDASPDRRRKAHRALADALPDREADRRAWHLALAALGPDSVACSALAQAGDRALERNAYEVAARAFERSSQLASSDASRAELLYRAARCAWDAGLPDRASQLIAQAQEMPAEETVSIGLEYLRGQIAARQGPVVSCLVDLLSAARRVATFSADESVIILAEATQAAFYAGDTTAMRQAADLVSALRGRVTSERAAFFAAMAEGMADTFSGRTKAGAEQLHIAVDIAEAIATPDDPQWHVWAAMCNLWLRERGTHRDVLEGAAEVARSRTALGALLYLLCYLAIDNAAGDRWADAEAGFHQVVTLARETGQRTDLAAALARLAWLEGRQGREDACVHHAQESLSLADELGLRVCEIWAHAALGELHLAHGRLEQASGHFNAQQAILDRCGIADVDLSPAPELVELHVRSADTARAADLAAAYQKEASEKGLPWALARAARARALLVSEAEMDSVFEEALEAHSLTPDRFETARTQLAYGSRLRRARQRARSREPLRAALETFDRLGAQPWAAQARAELTATGETARARNVSTRDQLTPQELQIALLLSAGRTTREAASALFLSPKTIEYHLRNVYRKLDCRNRQQLAAAVSNDLHD
jgi:DNA-binding CsgD family transcriptional regulator